jgi:hypothetical protein
VVTVTLKEDELVTLILQEADECSNSALAQFVYLLQRAGVESRFRFDYASFLGMRSTELEGRLEAERLRLALGKNGLSRESHGELRRQLRDLLSSLPKREADIRLIAVADFLRWNEWDSRSGRSLREVLDSVRARFAPDASLSSEDAINHLERLGLPTRVRGAA